MINFQNPEKILKDPLGSLVVHSIFKTIQGEGPFCGVPAVFVRLSGCNLQCPGCDTDYTSNRVSMSALQILTHIKELIGEANIKLIVITGGEPLRQNIDPLCFILRDCLFTIQIETNGSLPITTRLSNALSSKIANITSPAIYVVCSPKTGVVHNLIASRAVCYKYVISHDSVSPMDGLPLEVLEHPTHKRVARPPEGMPIYLQPMDSGIAEVNKLNLQAAIDSCTTFGYTLQLQTHKIIGLL